MLRAARPNELRQMGHLLAWQCSQTRLSMICTANNLQAERAANGWQQVNMQRPKLLHCAAHVVAAGKLGSASCRKRQTLDWTLCTLMVFVH